MRHLVVIALATLLTVPAGAQEPAAQGPTPQTPKAPPTADSLRGIMRRGVLLAQYDWIAWNATDAVRQLRPDFAGIDTYIARRIDSTWVVSFGMLTASRDTFRVVAEAIQSAARRDELLVRLPPAASDTGYYLRAARAVAVTRVAFGKPDRAYNIAVLPEGSEWFVYFYPAQPAPDCFLLGADVRYRVSADGSSILATRQLHNALIEFPGKTPDGHTLAAGGHAAVLDDIPEDTDVFHVLVRRPQLPQYIVTDAFLYRITPDGVITLMGRREDILGR